MRSERKKYMVYIDANNLRIGNTYINKLLVNLNFTREVVNLNGPINMVKQIHSRSIVPSNVLKILLIIQRENIDLACAM
jgi:hypothetical protein